jgi:hypothetical protein
MNMIDVMGAILLIAGAALLVGLLALGSGAPASRRNRFVGVVGAWFVVVVGLIGAGVFSRPPVMIAQASLGLAVLLPILAGVALLATSRGARELASGIPLPLLIAVHAGRLLGVFFLVLLAAGRLPQSFARSAGWGDITVALAALPVAWAAQRRIAGWRWLALGWNIVGIADLVIALTLGIGSAPRSPLQFIHESPGSAAITTFPWALIPTFFVPVFLLAHLILFRRLLAGEGAVESSWRPTLESGRRRPAA